MGTRVWWNCHPRIWWCRSMGGYPNFNDLAPPPLGLKLGSTTMLHCLSTRVACEGSSFPLLLLSPAFLHFLSLLSSLSLPYHTSFSPSFFHFLLPLKTTHAVKLSIQFWPISSIIFTVLWCYSDKPSPQSNFRCNYVHTHLQLNVKLLQLKSW